MIKMLRELFGLCSHQFVSMTMHRVYEGPGSSRPCKIRYVQRCKHCGKISTTTVKA